MKHLVVVRPHPENGLAIKLARVLVPVLGIGLALASTTSHAAFQDYLTERWYQTEILVFERTNISHTNTAELLTAETQGTQSAALRSFNAGMGSGYNLTSRTKRMLRAGSISTSDLNRVEQPVTGLATFELPAAVNASLNATNNTDSANTAPNANPDPLEPFLAAMSAFEQHLGTQSFRFVADQTPKLNSALTKLTARRGYRAVWRGHWIQPVPERDAEQPLLVQAGQSYDQRFQLEGNLGLTVSRFLHLNLNLWYYDPDWRYLPVPVNTEGPTASIEDQPLAAGTAADDRMTTIVGPNVYMKLHGKARMRSGEVHYIDHPKFGVLVRIDPVEPPTALTELYEKVQAAEK